MKPYPPRAIAIEQASNLGDVVSCLPLAMELKRRWPQTRVVFIARAYTRALVEACVHIDQFLDIDEVLADPALLSRHQIDAFVSPFQADPCGRAARDAGVAIRIGNLRRPRTMAWANRYIYQASRHSPRHIVELNLSFLRPLGIRAVPPTAASCGRFGLERIPPLGAELMRQLDPRRFNLIVHPKSNRNAREWPTAFFDQLIALLPPERYQVFVTGVAREREALLAECPELLSRPGVVDLMGRLSLPEMLGLIEHADGLVANSTGPLHIAGALGIHALGLFPGRQRANPQRWRPLGQQVETMALRSSCQPGPGRCPKDYKGEACSCMLGLTPAAVAERVLRWPIPLRPVADVRPAA